MAVMTLSLRQPGVKALKSSENKKPKKTLGKNRPITATLEQPLILDIKLLQKLDMTTFTKRGLIALSKFCGISLIAKASSKLNLNKCIQSIQGSKKQLTKGGSEGKGVVVGGGGGGGSGRGNNTLTVKGQNSNSPISENVKSRRSPVKPKISRYKPDVNIKIVEVQAGRNVKAEPDEDLDVVCKNDKNLKNAGHQRTSKPKQHKSVRKQKEKVFAKRKGSDHGGYDSTIEVVPEPCKSCSRPRQPERLHSHPKLSVRGKMENKKLEERLKTTLKLKDGGENCSNRKSPEKCDSKIRNHCAKNSPSPQKSRISVPENQNASINAGKPKTTKSSESSNLSSTDTSKQKVKKEPEETGAAKKSPCKIPTNKDNDCSMISDKENNDESTANEALKYVTGCYVCGAQVSPETRMQHERECISEWRNQNSVLAPEERKPEPRRPDYRFTASGEVDFNGTFESIWANHMDSLVPCKTCGRKFFPDRIERHENCCNNLSLRINFKH